MDVVKIDNGKVTLILTVDYTSRLVQLISETNQTSLELAVLSHPGGGRVALP